MNAAAAGNTAMRSVMEDGQVYSVAFTEVRTAAAVLGVLHQGETASTATDGARG